MLARTCCAAIAVSLAFGILSAAALGGGGFVADPDDPLFQELARWQEFDESDYGAGPLLEPGQTIHVKPDGNAEADGSSWDAATTLREAFRRAGPGDTVLLGEGVYHDHPLPDVPGGEPGRPVRVFAAPRQRVIISASRKVGPFRKSPGYEYVQEADAAKPRDIELYTATWEADSMRVLEPASSVDHVEELPGTFLFDEEEGKMYVRFHESDAWPGDGRHVYVLRRHRGMSVRSDYVHIRGLWIKHGVFWGLGVFGSHITVEDCAFFGNWGCGLYFSASNSLVRNNYGFANEDRGTIQFRGRGPSEDNLVIGNWADHSEPTWRSGRNTQRWAINSYGYGGRRTHVVGNVMNDSRSFRWKPPIPEGVFQGNVLMGTLGCEGGYYWTDPEDRLVHRANTFVGRVGWARDDPGPGGWGGNWYGTEGQVERAFFNNFVGGGDDEAIEAARFADLAYVDARLQSDSPLRGQALGGKDLGAFPDGDYRIFYVGPEGDDANPGTSERLAFGTLGKAASVLQPGDTLYVMAGPYESPLRLEASGTEAQPVVVRAYRKERVELPGIEIAGDWVSVEGFRVAGAQGDGVRVSGRGAEVKHCVVSGASGAAASADAPDFTLNHCTLVGSGVGLRLGPGAARATARNSVVAFNREAQTRVDAAALPTYRGYNNCYYGPEVDEARVAAEPGSVVADPQFVDAEGGDYRVQQTSPCVYLGEFRPPAGALGAQRRAASIVGEEVRNVQGTLATVVWRTPEDDSTGRVRYRKAGERRWQHTPHTLLGTRHAAALLDLEVEADYEAQVLADGRLAGRAQSGLLRFRTRREPREPRTYHLSPDGSDANDGLSPATAWRTIAKANEEAMPGDTVLIAPGVYRDPIRPIASGQPGKRITFKRSGEGEAIVDSGQVPVHLVSLERRSHITVDGLTFVSDMPTGHPPPVVRIANSTDVEILNCETRPVGRRRRLEAIQVISSRNIRIEGNVLVGQRYAIALWHSDDVAILHNTMARKSVYMLRMSGVRGLRFVGNLLYENRSFRNSFLLTRPGRDLDGNTGVFEVEEMDYNLYYTTDPSLGIGYNDLAREGGEDLAAWQELTGWDANSIQADPKFVDFEAGDYRLAPDSPALGAGPGGRNIGAY